MNIKAVYGQANVGDIVVLHHVSFGKESLYAKFAQPAFFRVEAKEGQDTWGAEYTLRHLTTGETIKTGKGTCSISSSLYRPDDVVAHIRAMAEEQLDSVTRERDRLRIERDLLERILTQQGIRVITEGQAKVLGLSANG